MTRTEVTYGRHQTGLNHYDLDPFPVPKTLRRPKRTLSKKKMRERLEENKRKKRNAEKAHKRLQDSVGMSVWTTNQKGILEVRYHLPEGEPHVALYAPGTGSWRRAGDRRWTTTKSESYVQQTDEFRAAFAPGAWYNDEDGAHRREAWKKPGRDVFKRMGQLRRDRQEAERQRAESERDRATLPSPRTPHQAKAGEARGGGEQHEEGGKGGEEAEQPPYGYSPVSPSTIDDRPSRATKPETVAEPVDGAQETTGSGAPVRESRFLPDPLERAFVEVATRRGVTDVLGDDPVLWRWAAFAIWYGWVDSGNGLRVLPAEALRWIAGDSLHAERTLEVLEYIQERLPVVYEPEIPARRCRLIVKDGLPPSLYRAIEADRAKRRVEHDEPVLFLSGHKWLPKHATELRAALKAEAARLVAEAPTDVARFVCSQMNDLPSRTQSKVVQRVPVAREALARLPLTVDLKRERDEAGEFAETEAELAARKSGAVAQLRSHYAAVLDSVEHQHQQFYAPSRRGRTDRAFAYNLGVLHLPKALRKILLQDFWEIDLAAAHLRIAASLWGATNLLAVLNESGFSIWQELTAWMDLPESPEVKAALKIALYSSVYGMKQSALTGQLTRDLRAATLDRDVSGRRFSEHPLIAELLDKREVALRSIRMRRYAVAPGGQRFDVRSDADERSCLASVAQHVEQQLMRVVLEYASTPEAGRFHVGFWLHDGCYVHIGRSADAHMKRLNERLDRRARELGVSARFDFTPPHSTDS